MATDGEAARPRDAEIPLAKVRSAPIRAQTSACATTAFSPDCSKRAFEVPILRRLLFVRMGQDTPLFDEMTLQLLPSRR